MPINWKSAMEQKKNGCSLRIYIASEITDCKKRHGLEYIQDDDGIQQTSISLWLPLK